MDFQSRSAPASSASDASPPIVIKPSQATVTTRARMDDDAFAFMFLCVRDLVTRIASDAADKDNSARYIEGD